MLYSFWVASTKPGAVLAGVYCLEGHLTELEALELEHLGALLPEHVSDGLRGLVDPRLVDEHLLGEEALVQHPFDDLLTRLLGLRLHLVGVRVDLPLSCDDLVGDVLAADPARGGRSGDVHGQLAGNLVRAAANLDQAPELVRRRVRVPVDDGAVDGLEASRSGDDDVLAELAGPLLPLLVELRRGIGAVALHSLEQLGGESAEPLVVRDRLGLAAEGNDDAALGVVGHAVPDLALGRLAAGALGCTGESALPQQRLRRLEVAVRVLEGALAVHHPGARLVASLRDQSDRAIGHATAPVGGTSRSLGAGS